MDLELSNQPLTCPAFLILRAVLFIRLAFVSILSRDRLILRVIPICVSGRCFRKLPSHLHCVQTFHHQDQRSPQLLKAKVWIHLHKQSKSIALTVGGSAHTEYSRATPKIFSQVGLDSHSQLASAFCTSLGWDS